MGVPKFYRWISERYPKINQVITDTALLPEFDHLYLDMNGIIHGCTHPSHLDVSDVLSEREMMLGIMHYIDRIITQIVKPKVSVFMAIDGVAPRAKLNQQRSRRFRSAKDLAEATAAANSKNQNGAILTTSSSGTSASTSDSGGGGGAFDSNCITPGTEFMARVSECIRYFIRKKIKEDPLWQTIKIIFSGHEVPGEGEHKIMEHIRLMKNQPSYQPNTRHCMYGQDADLIMLGLVSHEPHFTLLREIVDFGNFRKNEKNALSTVMRFTKQSDFQLLHLSILREYLEIDFVALSVPDNGKDHGKDHEKSSTRARNTPSSSTNLERIIDDFVFLTFLVGNDFLPHMPSLDIGDNAFDLLFDTYKHHRKNLWEEGEYLVNAGEISDGNRLESFLVDIGKEEDRILEEKEEDEALYKKKRRKWDKRDGKVGGKSEEEEQEEERVKEGKYQEMLRSVFPKEPIPIEKKDFKGRYYYDKLGYTPVDVDKHLALRKAYIEGLVWCLAYYYRGCISWGWFYPYHYGPMISDLTNLADIFDTLNFQVGEPLLPFHQLMGCLPPASSVLVPRSYRKLMSSPDSPIIHFYPQTFQVDMNGKRNPWEGVNILPFIHVDLLKSTISTHCPDHSLTSSERQRNQFGKIFCYSHDPAIQTTIPSFNRDIGLPDIHSCQSRVDVLDPPPFDIAATTSSSAVSFQPRLIAGTRIPYPGFPSLNVLPIESHRLERIGLNVFGMGSKYATAVLSLEKIAEGMLPGAEVLAGNVLGRHLFVNWPMMHEAKVVAVSDCTCEVRKSSSSKKPTKNNKQHQPHKIKRFTPQQSTTWKTQSQTLTQQYLSGSGTPGSGGVDIGNISIRLKLLPLQGMKTSPIDGSTKKVFGKEEADVPLQMVLWSAPAPDPRFVERGPVSTRTRFPKGKRVILTKGKHRGCLGSVLGVMDTHEKNTNNNNSAGAANTTDKVAVRVEVIPPEPPFGLAIVKAVQDPYVSAKDAAKVLNINPVVLGKVMGNLFFNPGRYDLGLNLKYNKEGLCVTGYSRIHKDQKQEQHQRGQKGKAAPNAWTNSDTLLVVGNKRVGANATDEGDNNNDDHYKSKWEYTPNAIRLVHAYRQMFPRLFSVLSKHPNERFYDAKGVFGPKGNDMLPKIRDWLNNVETAKLPRTPVATEAISQSAIAAIQRAADVRRANLLHHDASSSSDSTTTTTMTTTLVNLKVPPSALYREASTSATDVMLLSENNANAPPRLGDRIANLCANGLPFGARGTIVAIHDPKSGCVEVVMDEEFIGGSTLQGACSKFRGKLSLWAHLLKISAADSDDIVHQLMAPPLAASGNDAFSSFGQHEGDLLANSPNSPSPPSASNKSPPVSNKSPPVSNKSPPASNKSPTPTNKSPTPPASISPLAEQPSALKAHHHNTPANKQTVSNITTTPPNQPTEQKNKLFRRKSPVPHSREQTPQRSPSSSSTNTPNKRPGSSGRGGGRGGKQGSWREALGPGGIGFRSSRRMPCGVHTGLQAWRNTFAERETMMASNRKNDGKSTINQITKQTHPQAQSNINATAGLKAILGVDPSSAESTTLPQQQQQQQQQVPTAADALLRLMMKGVENNNNNNNNNAPPSALPPPGVVQYPQQQQQQPSTFNFSYVKEGEEKTSQQEQQQQQQQRQQQQQQPNIATMSPYNYGLMTSAGPPPPPPPPPPHFLGVGPQVVPYPGPGYPVAYPPVGREGGAPMMMVGDGVTTQVATTTKTPVVLVKREKKGGGEGAAIVPSVVKTKVIK